MLHPQTVAQVDVLMRADVDHRPRWQPGERLHHLFEARCDALQAQGQAATQLAVDSATHRLSYAALDAKANRLARQLLQLGHGSGDVIALLFDKSAYSYAAMLAVLKIHAAYVPLDASFPADRIGFMLGDAGVCRVLSTDAHRALLQHAVMGSAVAITCVDEIEAQLQTLPGQRLAADELRAPANELCYVIYTSGSTGRPKGVPIDHGQIVNFVRVAAETYGYRSDDRVYQGLTLAFDFAVEEIWVPLVVGATLLPNQTGGSLLGEDLARFLKNHRATALCCVPTLLATLDDTLPLLRLLIVSGEACPRDLVTRWHRSGLRFLNAYGPTEATVTATLGMPQPGQPVTIGQPLPSYAIVILAPDEKRALAFGEVGEIGIAGTGIASGYINRDEQTRKAFIADFIGVPHNTSGRIYRTGDLGRVNEQGEVEYLGRIDTQVKIRGYRIELAEIESVLLHISGVAQAVVNTWQSSPGVTELVAYFTVQPGTANPHTLPGQLANRLRELLPSYMVPAFYEPLAQMPMLASDKADRKALPPPAGRRLQSPARACVAPAGDTEVAIAQELATLLGLEQISADDHFFDDLGAHSLLMAQFSARLRHRLALQSLSMRDIYAQPSVRGLAGLAQAQALSATTPAAKSSTPAPTTSPTPAPTTAAPHIASRTAYLSCGAAQVLLALAFAWAHGAAWWHGWHWMLEAHGPLQIYTRTVVFSAAYFLAAAALPIALKWLLVGRWRPQTIPVWSWAYLRFWTVKTLVRSNPLVLFAGTPLYVLYLRLLGAQVAWSAQVGLRQTPVCTDLLHVGEGAVIGALSQLPAYQAVGGRIHLGPVHIGSHCHVGEGSFVDINTHLASGTRLSHASTVQAGQHLQGPACWQGNPAQPCGEEVAPIAEQDRTSLQQGRGVTVLRRWCYSASQLAGLWLVALPAPLAVALEVLDLDRTAQAAALADAPHTLGELLSLGLASYAAWLLLGLAAVVLVPRLLATLLHTGCVYPLYGFHFAVQRLLRSASNSKYFNNLFGDSSAIVHYLAALGYRFPELQQTGSNFGMAQEQDHPALCEMGSGTMVSDGIHLVNAEIGSQVFRLGATRLGAANFCGNALIFPTGAQVGDNCLLATKVLVPTSGPLRSGVGLLGSPAFEIPRSVRRDIRFDHFKQPTVRARCLRLKNRHNALTMLGFVASGFARAGLLALLWWLLQPLSVLNGPFALAMFSLAGLACSLLFMMAQDSMARGWRPLRPQTCSIYEPYFWFHERAWKLSLNSDHPLMALLAGTPLRGLVWRLMGMRVGRQLFDDGCAAPEKSLVTVGDHCTMGAMAMLQSHSLEDGVFKSEHVTVGNGCTVGASSFVHYGTVLGSGARVLPDAFVMKGEQLNAASLWAGNPARAVARDQN